MRDSRRLAPSRRVVVNGGLSRPAGTGAQRRPLTTTGTASPTMEIAPAGRAGACQAKRPHGVRLIRSYSACC